MFALSTSIALSVLALAIYGASDAISVVIRQSLVQLRTPSHMLGRVLAVNSMFTGSSGSLGEFRARVRRLARSRCLSRDRGIGAVTVMLVWLFAFPQLRRVNKSCPRR